MCIRDSIVKGENPKYGYVCAALILSILLSVVVYYIVERPLRHSRSRWVLAGLISCFFSCGVAGFFVWKGLITFRPVPPEMTSIPEAVNDKDMLARWTWTSPDGPKVLLYKAGGSGPQTVVLGDSNAQQYAPRLYELVKGNNATGRGIQYITAGGTPPIPGVENQKIDGCRDMLPTFFQYLSKDPRIDRIVIAAWWHGYFYEDSKYMYHGVSLGKQEARQEALKSLFDFIEGLRQKNKQVTLVISIPTGRLLDPKHLHARGFTGLYLSLIHISEPTRPY